MHDTRSAGQKKLLCVSVHFTGGGVVYLIAQSLLASGFEGKSGVAHELLYIMGKVVSFL